VRRRSTPEYQRFLSIARGSLSELDTQVQIATRLGYGKLANALLASIETVFAQLTALMNAIQKRGIR
jgi:four helix bundle protein